MRGTHVRHWLKSAITGRFVSRRYARRHQRTTYDQHQTAPLPRLDTLGPADEARIRAAMRDR